MEDSGLMSIENGRMMEQAGVLAKEADEKSLAKECLEGALWHWRELGDQRAIARVEGLLP